MSVSGNINFVTAEDQKFYYPLYRVGKQQNHLPLIMIDNEENLYLFPNFEDIQIPGRLKQFVNDFKLGKFKDCGK